MLQVIAMCTMFLDHIGLIFKFVPLRIIGRLAMPIYAYFVAKGCDKHKDYYYTRRLFRLAIACQLPFGMMTNETFRVINVCGTWCLCALFMGSISDSSGNRTKSISISVLAVLLLIILPFDYGILALLWVLLWWVYDHQGKYASIAFILPIVCISIAQNDYLQLFSFLAVPIIIICKNTNKERMSKDKAYLWRFFYPAHMVILSCLH